MAEPRSRHPDLNAIGMAAVFSALAHPARARIVESLLTRDDWTAGNCASFNLPLSRSSLTHHLRVMSDAGLVIQRDHGNRCEVVLRKEELDARFPGLLDLVRQGARERAGAR
ncbi:helix-turn-helix domain-containing protein [Streptomyces sp. SL13]|uniref:Helix-turn-helix domain-containing protein n=1 Tax=Streptantibioticus silvisoli TaxID=2705255 RepID=A0AA90K7I5_9ACTN|nr:helix-turn-helix domain-containing protein [Streptantibioticus silvisoli]MDI5965415.1 helix-turn-helix domain-containing protein [Streptantibioticus silvisoli]MDI5968938.1 helix-turn-helix domain-containing protein [Streptantibioticus silvisoli]